MAHGPPWPDASVVRVALLEVATVLQVTLLAPPAPPVLVLEVAVPPAPLVLLLDVALAEAPPVLVLEVADPPAPPVLLLEVAVAPAPPVLEVAVAPAPPVLVLEVAAVLLEATASPPRLPPGPPVILVVPLQPSARTSTEDADAPTRSKERGVISTSA
jgi:hypothetical protein